ncbi:MAG: Gfo/Idh/MocA family oxidoreductase [Lewinellaceae bacterium]|nr:Gfo/Idh/MocA family oxidoreductase [Lewinellaceae bacterium]
MKKTQTRRAFLKKSAAAGLGLAFATSARSYASILGANDRVNMAVIGLHGRGKALIGAASACANTGMVAICDVDKRELGKTNELVTDRFGKKAVEYGDIRRLLENKAVDAILIATPEHWHAPMTIMGVQAGKHVYVEKPCSHNPREGELLVEAREKYGKVIQMGTQQRSAPTSIQAIRDIRDGLIGDVYYGKAWYANNRRAIGNGKLAPVPDWLDWELWQGPAPREAYNDIYVHYNWHWFWKYGTGEINNNGTHEIDICRWAMGLKYPKSVSSSGGRFHFHDDWQFYDTQVVNYEFDGGKMISWEGRSCNGHPINGEGRGATLHGTEGTIMLTRNAYTRFDLDNKLVQEIREEAESATLNTVGAGNLDKFHMQNFLAAIRDGAPLHSPIDEGANTNLLCHLGNYSQKLGRKIVLDTATGRPLNDPEAMQFWSREYAPGWEPKV